MGGASKSTLAKISPSFLNVFRPAGNESELGHISSTSGRLIMRLCSFGNGYLGHLIQ